MEFKFIGNPRDPNDNKGAVTFYGITFPLNIPVKVDNPVAIKKLMGNTHFACVENGKTYVQMPVAKLIVPKAPELVAVAGDGPAAPAKPKRGRKAAVAAY